MTKKILITGRLADQAKQLLTDEGFEIVQYGHRDLINENDLVEALSGVYGYILGGDEIVSENVIKQTNNLKVISFLGIGYQTFIDAHAAKQKGIFVTNTPGANKQSVAEMAIGLLLSAQRQIVNLDQKIRDGVWQSYQSTELKGKTIGIIGMGEIGKCVAHIASLGFNMNVLYNSRRRYEDVEQKLNAKFVSKEELCKLSDYITLHISYDPKNPVTASYIDEKSIKLMKPTAIIINTARPETIDGHALYEALSNNKISCAAFDGYYTEPNVPTTENDQFRLTSLSKDKFIVTPHVAWSTREADINMCIIAAESIIEISKSDWNKNIVNN